jgi:hypothetical protein
VEEISEKLGIRPDVSHKVGEPRWKTEKRWEVNVWKIQERHVVPWESHYDAIQSSTDRLLRRVDSIADKLRQLCLECHGQLLIGTISKDVPGLHLSSDLIRKIANLGVDIEFDIICPEEEEVIDVV